MADETIARAKRDGPDIFRPVHLFSGFLLAHENNPFCQALALSLHRPPSPFPLQLTTSKSASTALSSPPASAPGVPAPD